MNYIELGESIFKYVVKYFNKVLTKNMENINI